MSAPLRKRNARPASAASTSVSAPHGARPSRAQREAPARSGPRASRASSPPPPGVVERCEGVRRDRAFERLLVGRELDVGAEFVRRKRREGDARLEGAAIEMRIFGSALEREARCGGNRRRRPWASLAAGADVARHDRRASGVGAQRAPLCGDCVRGAKARSVAVQRGRGPRGSRAGGKADGRDWLGQGQDRSARHRRQFPRNV